ncbi:hypothetical protein ACQP25_00900 [Microtetraspora malaysiensis]|uniref:hypothetical protein n=1 Tax=Microtetraspora malaysiensis TaxID=161358 RepID=UPI003D908E81
MIHLKLGPARPADPDDSMRRDWLGWTPDQTPQQIYERNRGRWYLSARAARERYTVFSSTVTGTIVAVVANEGVEDLPGDKKKAIVGKVLGPGDPVHDALIGQPMPDRHRNPVTYVDDPVDQQRTCACGCDGAVTGPRVFLPGHDQRAIHERIARQWGDTLGFLTWFDREYGS